MATPHTTDTDADRTSGSNATIWTLTAPTLQFEPLSKPLETEVLVIGGGVAGLTTAYCLAQSGRSVVLVEDGFLGSGETGRTTAHLTYVLDERYADLIANFGEEKTRRIMESHCDSIDWMRETVEREQIDCHFRMVDGYLFAHPTDIEDTLLQELEATQLIGCPTTLEADTPDLIHGTGKPCLRFPDQAQFHSLLYLQGLADAILRMGGQIYTQSRAEQITSKGAEVNGFTVLASHIVVTTNTTVNNILRLHTKQWPYRSYAMAFRVPAGSIVPALWWDTGDKNVPWVEKPYHYVRIETGADGSDYLIAGGEDHRTGQEDREEISQETRYDRIAAWTKAHFPGVSDVVARWSGQIMYSIDGLGFAGRNPGSDNMYVITGDSGNGMTNATTGARIITDFINGRENPAADLFDPSRSVVKHAAGSYLRETGNMLAQYGDWFTPGDPTTVAALQPGEGAVIRDGLKKLAIYRDEHNRLHTCSAVCPHLGGAILHWNKDERTFDCPLHGSRFTGEGKVVNGPANEDLGRV